MSMFPHFLRSVLLTSLLSFLAPTLLVGGMLASLSVISYIPGLELVGRPGAVAVWSFLATFGNGCAIDGIWTIGATCGLVGAMFDTYAFYRYQALRGN